MPVGLGARSYVTPQPNRVPGHSLHPRVLPPSVTFFPPTFDKPTQMP
jgi:hypothetical protein